MKNLSVTPEGCAGAVCAGCLKHFDSLKCCSNCKRAWYCSAECQRTDWRQGGHKEACAAAAPVIEALTAALAAAPHPSSYQEAINPIAAAGRLVVREHQPNCLNCYHMVSSTVFCSVCLKARDPLPAEQRKHFKCCNKCLWGWTCCEEHREQYRQQHQRHCAKYAAMSSGRLAGKQHLLKELRTSGEAVPLHFCPRGKMQQPQQPQQQQHSFRLPTSWQGYKQDRGIPPFSPAPWLCMTQGLSVPLTAALACSHLYSSSTLARIKKFTLHLVGSADYEFEQVLSTTVIEEEMHLLPAVNKLHVVLIGPEMERLTHTRDAYVVPMDKGTCPECDVAGCSRLYSIYRGTYEAYAASPRWSNPTLALALNSGVGQQEEDSWANALQVLLDKDIPTCFTCYQQTEAAFDSQALAAAGAAIVHGPEPNPFMSLAPLLDVALGPDRFYHCNEYYICVKGRRAPLTRGG